MLKLRKLFYLFVLIASLSIILCSCKTTEKTYTYNDISEEQKVIVDGVMGMIDNWETARDSGKDIPCLKNAFFLEDGKLIFSAFYSDDTEKETNVGTTQTGFYKFYEVDQSNGSLSGHRYTYLDKKNKVIAYGKTNSAPDFPVGATFEEQRDILANNIYKAFNEGDE